MQEKDPYERETKIAKILVLNQMETFWLNVGDLIHVYRAAYPLKDKVYYTTDEWTNPQRKPMFKPEDLLFIS